MQRCSNVASHMRVLNSKYIVMVPAKCQGTSSSLPKLAE
uniref:Uncharacterized protein n=1 Tax=Arundo donax TaxID=35708 RepID=A0A0A9AVR6_ARUDO